MKVTTNGQDNSNLLQNEVLIPGMKVRQKAGGPEMFIVGFCSSRATSSDNKFILQGKHIYPKLEINHQGFKLTDFHEGSQITHIPEHLVYPSLVENIPENTFERCFYAVLKYYSKKEENFVFDIVHISEFELV